MEKKKVLWIEDGARFDLPFLAAPVYMEGGYDLIVAENVSDSITYLQNNEFSVIIIDIRLSPGKDPQWEELYKKAGFDKVSARLGLHLIYSVLEMPSARIKLPNPIAWITSDKIGILTVETYGELKDDLEKLGIKIFQQKHADIPETTLLDLIKKVQAQN